MIDFAIEAYTAARRRCDYEACLVRFRLIMMTTMAALMGTPRSRWVGGAGSEARRPPAWQSSAACWCRTLTLYAAGLLLMGVEWLAARRQWSPTSPRPSRQSPAAGGCATKICGSTPRRDTKAIGLPMLVRDRFAGAGSRLAAPSTGEGGVLSLTASASPHRAADGRVMLADLHAHGVCGRLEHRGMTGCPCHGSRFIRRGAWDGRVALPRPTPGPDQPKTTTSAADEGDRCWNLPSGGLPKEEP